MLGLEAWGLGWFRISLFGEERVGVLGVGVFVGHCRLAGVQSSGGWVSYSMPAFSEGCVLFVHDLLWSYTARPNFERYPHLFKFWGSWSDRVLV